MIRSNPRQSEVICQAESTPLAADVAGELRWLMPSKEEGILGSFEEERSPDGLSIV